MSNPNRGHAIEKMFIDSWKHTGFSFERNPRSDRMKKMIRGFNAEADLVSELEPIFHKVIEHAASLGHEEAHEAPLGFKLSTVDPDIADIYLRLHLNSEYIKHPRPSPDSRPMAWFGTTASRRWNENTRDLWGGVDGGLLANYRRQGYKTWPDLRAHDKASTIELISLMRDAIYEECLALDSQGICEFIKYLGLGSDSMHILINTLGTVKSEIYGAAPVVGEPVVVTRKSHDFITLSCGLWTFSLRIHSADGALTTTSFKVEVAVPEHP